MFTGGLRDSVPNSSLSEEADGKVLALLPGCQFESGSTWQTKMKPVVASLPMGLDCHRLIQSDRHEHCIASNMETGKFKPESAEFSLTLVFLVLGTRGGFRVLWVD